MLFDFFPLKLVLNRHTFESRKYKFFGIQNFLILCTIQMQNAQKTWLKIKTIKVL